MKQFFSGAGIFIAVLILLAIITLLGLAWRFVFAPVEGTVEAREQIQGSGDFRIAAYDEFFQLCAAVQNQEARIDSLEQELETGPSESRRGQIQATLTAVRAARAESINEYNAAASRDYTVGQFRDSNLPYELHLDTESTQCAS